jgi:hypothetical protein
LLWHNNRPEIQSFENSGRQLIIYIQSTMGGITIINKTITQINVVVLHLAFGGTPIGFGRHMNILPGAQEDLDIGDVLIKQFRVYVWGGPGTEMSSDTIRSLLLARNGASLVLSAVTGGTHELASGIAESAIAEASQHLIMHHIANEVVTSHAMDKVAQKVIDSGINKSINWCVDRTIYPKEWGVCSKFFWAALDDNVCYVYGGPCISNGKIVPGEKLRIRENDNGYDPVEALNELAKSEGEDNKDAVIKSVAGAALVAGGALLVGASLPLTAVVGGAYYWWKSN